jgi:hypothetical protein
MPLFNSSSGSSDEAGSDDNFQSDSNFDIPDICLNYNDERVLQAVAYRPPADNLKKYKTVIGDLVQCSDFYINEILQGLTKIQQEFSDLRMKYKALLQQYKELQVQLRLAKDSAQHIPYAKEVSPLEIKLKAVVDYIKMFTVFSEPFGNLSDDSTLFTRPCPSNEFL